MILYNLFCASFDELSCVSAMGGMPDERYLPSCLRLSSLLLTGWVRKIKRQKARKIIRHFTLRFKKLPGAGKKTPTPCRGSRHAPPLMRIRTCVRPIQRRAKAAGIETKIGNHTFRATGITAYLKNSGKLEVAQHIANHESPRTTKLYDRRQDEISLDEIERMAF